MKVQVHVWVGPNNLGLVRWRAAGHTLLALLPPAYLAVSPQIELLTLACVWGNGMSIVGSLIIVSMVGALIRYAYLGTLYQLQPTRFCPSRKYTNITFV